MSDLVAHAKKNKICLGFCSAVVAKGLAAPKLMWLVGWLFVCLFVPLLQCNEQVLLHFSFTEIPLF